MLAGQAQSMKTCVYKAEAVGKMWGDYPVVFRLVMLPFILLAIARHRMNGRELVFVNLGRAGEELDLMNDHLMLGPDDPDGMKTAAFAADLTLQMSVKDAPLRDGVMSALAILQTAVWCIQGKSIVLVVTGPNGGMLPEWAWEYVRNGPQITNVRIKSFDEPETGGEDSGGPPTGHPGDPRR